MSDITQNDKGTENTKKTQNKNLTQEEKKILSCVLVVEASNTESRLSMTRRHKPNLGPYTSTNILRCQNCGKIEAEWSNDNEECLA